MVRDPDLVMPGEGGGEGTEAASPRDESGVLLVWPRTGSPYLMRTNVLARRLSRLRRMLDFPKQVDRVELWYTRARIEQALIYFQLAKAHFPENYHKMVRLPSAPYLKLLLKLRFPRTELSSRLSGKENLILGPFRNRAEAERFESEMLDFFQLRRCSEDLEPHAEHPGCIYGEMGQCLRPCQDIVGEAEYATEAAKAKAFLASRGESLREAIGHARDRASANLEFEEAARQHKRLDRVEALWRGASEITGEVGQANGVTAVRREAGVDLYFLLDGVWREPVEFRLHTQAGESQAGESMDRRLRQLVEELPTRETSAKDREEHLALLHRWYFSSWRDTEWLPFPAREEIPYRKLVRMISRAASGKMESNDPKVVAGPAD
ncbi:MAG: hypothetical protein OHK0021_14710 [Bryobacter sp.]